MQIIYDGKYVQVLEFVFQGLNIGKWSTGKHVMGLLFKKNVKTIVSKMWHPSFFRRNSRSSYLAQPAPC